ncbi:MAG: YSC84-related protein [Planctomycetota bacterium]
MKPSANAVLALAATFTVTFAIGPGLAGCGTAPKTQDRAVFKDEAKAAKLWFETNVPGVKKQIADSAGYIVFPHVGQAGFVIGGTYGRGAVYDARGLQTGWAAVSKGSLGLQIGGQGFKMLMVLEDDKAMRRFKNGSWSGDVGATVVLGTEGGAATAPFHEGVAIYIGDQSGAMAGMQVALANISYRGVGDVE